MKGSIRKRGKGNWQIQIYTGAGADGKPQRVFETVHCKNKKDAQPRLNQMLSDMDKGIYVVPGHSTVAEHLHTWLESYAKNQCGAMTQDGYTNIVENHLIPALGNVKLKELRHQMIENYYNKACKTLSPRTVTKHHRLLSQAMKWAVRKGYIGQNPCDFADPPAWKGKEMRTLTEGELKYLLDIASDSSYYPIYYTAVSTGLRQAELLGLRWRDVNLEEMALTVSQVLFKRRGVCVFKEPKTSHSRRTVALTPKLTSYLREYKAERESLYLHLSRVLGLDSLVFAREDGKPIDPSMLSHEFHKIVLLTGLEDINFHSLRHTFASLMLMKGANIKVISEAMGHSTINLTLSTYSHTIKGMSAKAMALLDEVLPAGVFQNSNVKLTPTVDIKKLITL